SAAGVTARGNVTSKAGGRGYLPRPRSGMALCQCRTRQPRPVEGDVGHRALPHGGARRPRPALRELLAHRNLLQLLPQPALPEVPRGCSQGVASRTRGGAAAGAVLSRGIQPAGQIADIAYQNKAVIYDLLFKASSETVLTIAADPKHLGTRIGILSVLH